MGTLRSGLQGFCIEINEKLLAQSFPESGFGDVDYLDEPDPGLKNILYRAYVIGKYRYLYMLNRGVFSAAYYTKAMCWNYEQERRMIASESETRKLNELILMDVPNECVTALICGPRASEQMLKTISEKASQIGCKNFRLKIGRTLLDPFFIDESGDPFIFNGTEFAISDQFCDTCDEPISKETGKCSWCQITESHIKDAALRNPFRTLEKYGLLENYMKTMRDIDQK